VQAARADRPRALVAVLCAQQQFATAAHVAELLGYRKEGIGHAFVEHVLDTATLQRRISHRSVHPLEAAAWACREGKNGIALQFPEKSQRFSRSALLCAQMSELRKSCGFLAQALDQDVLCRFFAAARNDGEGNPWLEVLVRKG
jgi:hypothetical protein